MNLLGHWSHDDVLRIVRRLNGGTFGQTTGDTVRAVLHAADAVPADQLAGAVGERDAFAHALRLAVASPELRKAYVRQAKDSLARERGQ